MSFVVTENCINCKHTYCADVCPVDAFAEGPNFLVINPDECIECGLCEPACIVGAIMDERSVPGDQRIKFGFEFPGTSFMFPLSKGVGVFLDMSGNRTQWWFDHPSAKGACDLVDRTVRGKHSGFKQLADEKRKEPNMRRRVLEAELQPQRFAQIEMSYPEPNANSGLFVVQVFGLQRVGDKFYATRLPAMIPDIQGLN